MSGTVFNSGRTGHAEEAELKLREEQGRSQSGDLRR